MDSRDWELLREVVQHGGCGQFERRAGGCMIRALAFAITIAFCAGMAHAETIDIGGVARTYLTQFPETKPAPLVIVLHGNTQSGADMRTRTSWSLVANRERFGVIYPDGLNRAWADLRPD